MTFALFSIFLFTSFAVALSLKCYVCSDCGSSNGKEQECWSGLCFKVYMKGHDKESTVRGCTNEAGCAFAKATCKAVKDAKKDAECETPCCDSHLCNSGAAPSFNVSLVSLCFLFTVVPFFK